MTHTLQRTAQSDDGTFGMLASPDGKPICLTLEPPWHANQHYVSCIPAGSYQVGPHDSPQHPDTWEVLNVPGRTAILLHAGNTNRDSLGCILVGQGLGYFKDRHGVTASQAMMKVLRGELPPSFVLIIKDVG